MTVHRYTVRRRDDGRATRRASEARVREIALDIGTNLLIGERDFTEQFGVMSTLETDLLTLGAAIFAADRATPRGQREDIARRIELRVPVVNGERLTPLVPTIETVLRRLSQDAWTVHLMVAPGDPEEDLEAMPTSPGAALLFSGGLDSLAAAIEFAGMGGAPLELVSHRTSNTATSRTQAQLAAELTERGLAVSHRQFFVSSRDGGNVDLDHDVENTQRTRSFLFLVLGGLVARRTGRRDLVYIAENGQMAIHLPITTGRIGAFSTHTAHPDVLADMERFLSAVLAVPLRVYNPYVQRTKREVVAVVHSALPELLPIANSCWRNARLQPGNTHCGECVPCYVRRIAIECLGADGTAYARDVWSLDQASLSEDDIGRRNLADLAEFRWRFATQSADELMAEFPELYSSNMDGEAVVAMYRRWAAEAASVWGRYPNLRSLL